MSIFIKTVRFLTEKYLKSMKALQDYQEMHDSFIYKEAQNCLDNKNRKTDK